MIFTLNAFKPSTIKYYLVNYNMLNDTRHPKKPKPKKLIIPKPELQAHTSDNKINLVTFSFDHQTTSFKSKITKSGNK